MSDLNPQALYSRLEEDLNYLGPCERPSAAENPESAAKYLMLENFLKKFRDVTDDQKSRADTLAIAKFISMSDRCTRWERPRESLYEDYLLGHLKDELHKFFNPKNRDNLFSTYDHLIQNARCGPGVSFGSRGTDFYTKLFSSDLTYTSPHLLGIYHAYLRNQPLWEDAERVRSQTFGSAVRAGCKVTTVPKNVDISRTIAIEPSLNIFFQLGIGEVICQRLKTVFGIDVSIQPDVNRSLAREGSLSGRLVSIDLESASDTMSRKMMQYVLDPFTFGVLNRFVSSEAVLVDPESGLPRQESLGMLSTMGNGFTFPLQTALFACIVSASRSFLGLRRERAGKSWSVFGDDIICDQRVAGAVCDLLYACGFITNTQKSFFQGPFRESCGHDYYRGLNVRAVYLKTLQTQQARCAAINQLNHWSARTGINLPRTCRTLLESVRYLPVPVWDNDDAGVKVPYSVVHGQLPRHKAYQSIMYHRYESEPNKLVFGEGTVKAPRGQNRRIFNPNGVFLAMLNGTLVNGMVSVRHNVNHYRRRLAIAPNWDWSSAVSVFATDMERQRWETAVELNLFTEF